MLIYLRTISIDKSTQLLFIFFEIFINTLSVIAVKCRKKARNLTSPNTGTTKRLAGDELSPCH